MSARTTRRKLFGASAAAALIGPTVASAAPSADAALLAACSEYHRAQAEWHGPPQSEAHGDRLCDARNSALRAVMGLEPRTQEGLRAKASVAHSAMLFEANSSLNPTWREDVDEEHVLAIDVLRDLAGRASTVMRGNT